MSDIHPVDAPTSPARDRPRLDQRHRSSGQDDLERRARQSGGAPDGALVSAPAWVFSPRADDHDFQIHVAARSAEDLPEIVVTHLSGSRDIASTETHLVFEHLGGGSLVV